MMGDPTMFAREDYVEEAWRIVDPVLKADTALCEYEPGTWGPGVVNQAVSPAGGWHNPEMRDVNCGDSPKASASIRQTTKQVIRNRPLLTQLAATRGSLRRKPAHPLPPLPAARLFRGLFPGAS